MSTSGRFPTAVADTDVISMVFKHDSRSALYARHLQRQPVILSFTTIAELERWAAEHRWGDRRRRDLSEFLEEFIVYDSTRELCTWWASVMVEARRNGRRIEVADAWIAATALRYEIPLITHNPSDFAGLRGLRIITEAAR